MAELTEQQLEEGRNYIRNWELEKLDLWMNKHKVVIDTDLVIRTMKKCQMVNDVEKAIKMFDAAFVGMDPAIDRLAGQIRVGLVLGSTLLIVLGCLGGIAFLGWLIFG